MKEKGHYVPPSYTPLIKSEDADAEVSTTPNLEGADSGGTKGDPIQWSSGICACFDDTQSCMLLLSVLQTLILLQEPNLLRFVYGCTGFIGLFCPCYVFAKNAEFLGSGTFAGPCLTHCISWSLVNTIYCFATSGLLLSLPGCFVSCYTYGYRRSLRAKYNLEVECSSDRDSKHVQTSYLC